MYFILPGVPRREKKKSPQCSLNWAGGTNKLVTCSPTTREGGGSAPRVPLLFEWCRCRCPSWGLSGELLGLPAPPSEAPCPFRRIIGLRVSVFSGQRDFWQLPYKHSGGCGCHSKGLGSAASHFKVPVSFFVSDCLETSPQGGSLLPKAFWPRHTLQQESRGSWGMWPGHTIPQRRWRWQLSSSHRLHPTPDPGW